VIDSASNDFVAETPVSASRTVDHNSVKPPEPNNSGGGILPQIPKRKRFEVFKRDGFVCLYCGRTPPAVTLHVDHLVAKSKGGTNDDTNLVTSCADCNLGKSNIPIAPVVPSHDHAEKLAQLQAMAQKHVDTKLREQDEVSFILKFWINLDGHEPNYAITTRKRDEAIRRFLKDLSSEQIMDSLAITYENLSDRCEFSTFKYFCGVCWRKIKGDF